MQAEREDLESSGSMGGIYNKSRKKRVAQDFELADSIPKRALGLMFRCGLKMPVLFVFDNRSRYSCSIHSLFVFFPFSAIFLDEGKRVVDVRIARPFVSFIIPKKRSKYLIEGKPELAELVRVGDVLEFGTG